MLRFIVRIYILYCVFFFFVGIIICLTAIYVCTNKSKHINCEIASILSTIFWFINIVNKTMISIVPTCMFLANTYDVFQF